MVGYKTLSKIAEETGYTEKALRNKIQTGVWEYGVQWWYAPDSRIMVSIEAYNSWVESGLGQALSRPAPAQSKSALCIAAGSAVRDFRLSPAPLT